MGGGGGSLIWSKTEKILFLSLTLSQSLSLFLSLFSIANSGSKVRYFFLSALDLVRYQSGRALKKAPLLIFLVAFVAE